MFLLYAIVAGLLIGLLVGGRPSGLASLDFRWSWLAVAGFAIQILLFSAPITERVGDAGPPIYVASTGLVLVAVLRNARIPGMVLVALGAACNLAAIVANRGYMPASPEALAAIGHRVSEGYSNSAVVQTPAVAPLTDIFALPAGMPFTNVFSIGDVLIAVGVALAIVIAMRGVRPRATGAAAHITQTQPGTSTSGS